MKKRFFYSLLLSTTVFASANTQLQESSLIIYNEGNALVHEKRSLHVTKQTQRIVYEDVASTINTDSVNVKFPQGIALYSQQYKYDQLTLSKLLREHIGKKIKIKVGPKTAQKIVDATLLSDTGNPIVKTADGKIFSVNAKQVIFSQIPKTLLSKPSLVWNVGLDRDIDGRMQLDYLIKKISFKSDYVLDYTPKGATLTGWLNVNNNSGKSFKQTKLSFLAGDVHFVNKTQPATYKSVRAVAAMQEGTAAHQSFEGYHFYTVPFKVDIANNENTQIKFLKLENIDAKKEYVAHLSNPLYLQSQLSSDVLQNIVIDSLDEPLPKGVVRIYSKLDEQSVLLGESHINHTPKNTKITLAIGKNFDLKVTQTSLGRDAREHFIASKIRYSIKNRSDETKTVRLLIPFSNDKSAKVITKQKFRYTKGNLVTFELNIPSNATRSFIAEFEKQN